MAPRNLKWPLPYAFFRQRRQHPMRRTWSKKLTWSENGQSTVEFALTMPILLAFIFGFIQICFAFYSHAYISELAREGCRYAAFHGPSCKTSAGASCEVTNTTGTSSYPSVQGYISEIGLPNLGGGTVSSNATYPDGELVNEPVVVVVTYTFPYHIPWIKNSTLRFSSTSEMYIVQ